MADYRNIIPFIKRAEGGYVNDPLDSGGETNKGITYTVWCSEFGTLTHDRFVVMSDEDWGTIFKSLFWDKILGDQIQSQRIADIIVDWVWGSGKHYPEADVQDILIHSFGAHIQEDGNFGTESIQTINTVNEPTLYQNIIDKRKWFFDQCVVSHPTNERFINGWKNRLDHLVTFELTGELV